MRYQGIFFVALALAVPASLVGQELPSLEKGWSWTHLIDEQTKELIAFTDQQSSDYENALDKLGREYKETLRAAGLNIKSDADKSKYIEFANAARTTFEGEIRLELQTILLPEQIEQLGKIVFWREVSQATGEFGTLFSSAKVCDDLGIDDQLKKDLIAKGKELPEEFAQEFVELREKYRKKLLEDLSKEQREKLEALIGDTKLLGGKNVKF